jgi:hypothetical protein
MSLIYIFRGQKHDYSNRPFYVDVKIRFLGSIWQ